MLRSRRFLLLAALWLLCILVAQPVVAQERLLSPEAFLGYAPGTRFTPYHRVMDYVAHVAAFSSRVRPQPYGETYEGRPLQVALVASPENMERLETLRTDNLKRAGLMTGTPESPPVALVWLSYNVHGNEAVSTEAAMLTLYDLANPENVQTGAWLDNTVVILDPCINPDGRDRYVNWYNQMLGRTFNPGPDAREHREPWPGGRTNHYYFDLNRDWAWMTQVETQQRIALYNQWLPHVHVDFHEQGVDAPYYFAPAAQPYHEDITPWQRAFQASIGQNHARYFDANGWLYFTRQVFDLFYPAYGDTWPTYNGAIGMTYEQGGSGRAGLGIITAEGDTLTLRDRIDHHHTTSLSTVETTAGNSDRVVSEFQQLFERNRTDPPGAYKAYLIKGRNDGDKLAALADLLTRQDLRYGYADRGRSVRGFDYGRGTTGSVQVDPGDLVISAFQPKSVLAKVLFEPRNVLVDSLTYDITAWALPYAYGLEAYALTDRLEPDTDTPPVAEPSPADLEKPYAYLVRWKSLADVQFLSEVLQAGIKLRYAARSFDMDGVAYDPGTLILTRTGNEAMGARFDRVIRAAAAANNQPLHAVGTGFVTRGADFGSGDVPFLAQPKVAVLAGSPVSSSAVGEVWHFFDRQIGYPATLVHVEDLSRLDLSDYNVLIMPTGGYGSVLTDALLSDLKAWIRAGGRLIALESAVSFLAGKDGFDIKVKENNEDKKEEKKKEEAKEGEVPQHRYGDQSRAAISDDVPGSIYRVEMDASHPLGFGYTEPYYTLKRSDRAYAYLTENSAWNVGVIGTAGHVSGFTGYRAKEKLNETLVFGVQGMGRGSVVYLVDDPLFRAFWYNGKLLFGNAVFMR